MCLLAILSGFLAVVLGVLSQLGKERAWLPGPASPQRFRPRTLGLSEMHPTWLTPQALAGPGLDLQNGELFHKRSVIKR